MPSVRPTLAIVLALGWLLTGPTLPAAPPVSAAPPAVPVTPLPAAVELTDLDGKAVRPFAATNATAFVLVFISNDCPICNRYAPELARLATACRERGAEFWLVHPLVDETPSAIRQHATEYSLPPLRILRDPKRRLTGPAGISVTPEALVVNRQLEVSYRGRLDDRFPALGRQRSAATRHDLLEALGAVVAGRPVPEPRTAAVGCVLPALE